MYSYNYVRLTKTRTQTPEKFNREAMKLVTGVPMYTEIRAPMAEAQMNTLEDLTAEYKESHIERLQITRPG